MPVDSERHRQAECVLEPIRTPGTVQPHGALIVFGADGRIVQASESTGALLGRDATSLLGASLSSLVGSDVVEALAAVRDPASAAQNPTSVTLDGVVFDVIVGESGDFTVAEFEPDLAPSAFSSAAAAYAVAHRLARAASEQQLQADTVAELQRLTGFDRVMLYHFHPDGHGEVVAEERADGMDPYLGLHYPASDIPAQARELYLTKLSRVIASSSADSSALISATDLMGDLVSDLSHTELRSVSPHHLQFMRNMGQASTMSFSLVHDNELVGMITCAHRTPRRMPFELRQALEMLANQVALQLNSMNQIAVLQRQRKADGMRLRLIGKVTAADTLERALLDGDFTVLDLVGADGVTLMLDGHATSLGEVPSSDVLAGQLVITSQLSVDQPHLAARMPGFAGLIAVPLGGEGNYLAWFRREVAQTVRWLGDQTAANRVTPLSPRNSFTSWTQEVAGRSLPWDDAARDAVDLCSDIESALLTRAESQLAALALQDALTGLPNRRLLMDRLEHALAKYARGQELTVLFIDLDGFKAVNDTFGHDAGDAVLVTVATRLRSICRSQDTVARLGGDEFVVLCENTTAEEGDVLAARIVAGLRHDASFDGRFMTVTASVGVAQANLSFSAVEVLRAADAAMYRAKERGRDRASR